MHICTRFQHNWFTEVNCCTVQCCWVLTALATGVQGSGANFVDFNFEKDWFRWQKNLIIVFNCKHKYFYVCRASGSSLANLQQRVAIIGSPPLLDVIWRTQGTRNSKEQQRLGRDSSSWCLLSFAVKNPQIHNNHGCTTTINWFRRTCNESKITLYYWLYTMFIMQFTDLLIIHFFSCLCFSFLSFETRLFHWPWKPAK